MLSLHSRIIAFLIGLTVIFIIILFVRRKSLEPMYSFVWVLIGIFFTSIAFFPKIIFLISALLGISAPNGSIGQPLYQALKN